MSVDLFYFEWIRDKVGLGLGLDLDTLTDDNPWEQMLGSVNPDMNVIILLLDLPFGLTFRL